MNILVGKKRFSLIKFIIRNGLGMSGVGFTNINYGR